MVGKFLSLLKIGLIGLAVLFSGYFAVATALSLIGTRPDPISCPKHNQVYITSNGVHLDLIISRDYLPDSILADLDIPAWVNYLAFGWGDREFYINTPTWEDLELSTAFQALFLNTESAVHVVWIKQTSPNWTEIAMCDVQIQDLNNFVISTFKKDAQGNLIEIHASGYTSIDKFYQAHGNFSCIQTCNNWVNRSLKAAQVSTSLWSPFDKGVLYHQSQ